MTIPGQQNASLAKFEETFYRELQRQHDRVHLFVISKADELSRRLGRSKHSPSDKHKAHFD
jgi:SPX domain protein involved in polyphosphate accumulation